MRRSHPSSLDPKGLAGIAFDVCSIASTETASTVAGRGRGALRKRRGGGPVSGGAADEDDFNTNGVSATRGALYADPFSSMFSPTSALGGGGGGLMGGGRRLRSSSGLAGNDTASTRAMGPPDSYARRSHSNTLIGNKQNLRSTLPNMGTVQSVRVELSPTGSPVTATPNASSGGSVVGGINAPAINAFRRCLLMNRGGGGSVSNSSSRGGFHLSSSGASAMTALADTADTATTLMHPHTAGNIVEFEVLEETILTVPADNDDDSDEVIEEEETHHIFLFDNDDDDAITTDIASSSSHLNPSVRSAGYHSHTGGKERRAAVSRKQHGCANNSSDPYKKAVGGLRPTSNASSEAPFASFVGVARKQRRACRSRYDIDEGDDDGEVTSGGCDEASNNNRRGHAAFYYVQVSHSALTPRDGPSDLSAIPQMPLLPSSVATAVIDEELAVLEELML